jgi:hypothetical protein
MKRQFAAAGVAGDMLKLHETNILKHAGWEKVKQEWLFFEYRMREVVILL